VSEILRDEFKGYPESALYMIGTIAEVEGKTKTGRACSSRQTGIKALNKG